MLRRRSLRYRHLFRASTASPPSFAQPRDKRSTASNSWPRNQSRVVVLQHPASCPPLLRSVFLCWFLVAWLEESGFERISSEVAAAQTRIALLLHGFQNVVEKRRIHSAQKATTPLRKGMLLTWAIHFRKQRRRARRPEVAGLKQR